jgi:hypothetical protein
MGHTMLSGCNPNNINVILTNDDSINKLNDLVKERTIQATTSERIYAGNNIIVRSDSTIIQNIYSKPRVIPYSNMKNIIYTTVNQPLNGIIELKNGEKIKANSIYISASDTVIKFDEVIINSETFPTIELLKIQRRDHLHSTVNGFGYGIMGGAAIGAILGTFIGNTGGNGYPGQQQAGSQNEGTPRVVIFMVSTIIGGILGSTIGTLTGAILGQWQDIDVTYRYEKNSQ